MTRGGFITLEGGEGAGKSAQTRRLKARLDAMGFETVATREPGGTPHAEALRALILSGRLRDKGPAAEAIAFSAARIDHIDALIAPARARGAFVICDRFADSTRAYQGAAGALPLEFLERLERVAVGDCRPDLTFVIDLAPETGLARAAARRGFAGADRFEAEGLAFHHALRAGFLAIARAEPDRCRIVDGAQDEESVGREHLARGESAFRARRGAAMRRPVSEEGAPESDVFPGALSPRVAPRVIGHEAAEAAMLEAYRGGRLAHAWLLSGPRGNWQGDARLRLRALRAGQSRPDFARNRARDPPERAGDPSGGAAIGGAVASRFRGGAARLERQIQDVL